MSKPFIIWTLQRTGGTNLARRLFERSGLLEAAKAAVAAGTPGAVWLENINDQWKLHEPFNTGKLPRVFSRVTEQWINTKDKDALAGAMDEMCSLKLPIKHCVEMVPWEISEALAVAACKADYANIFLYRKNPVNRLLSLQFAKLSGIWGPELKGENELNEKIFAQPLPVAKLVDHEKRSARRLGDIWRYLTAQNSCPRALAYEDVFQAGNDDQPAREIMTLLSSLQLSQGKKNDLAFVSEIIGRGDQGTRDKYRHFIGIEELEAALKDGPRFTPETAKCSMEVVRENEDHRLLLHAAIDAFPTSLECGQSFELGGVAVLNEPSPQGSALRLVTGGAETDIKWDISSPWMAKRFPGSPNCTKARFKVDGLRAKQSSVFEICLDDGGGNRMTIFKIMLKC
jgi:hypothetical protein